MTNTLLPAVENSDDKMMHAFGMSCKQVGKVITPLKVHSVKYKLRLEESDINQSCIDFADYLYTMIDSEMSAFVDKYKRS